MRIYLAHNYAARYELRGICIELGLIGHVITSRWIDNEHEGNTNPVDAIADHDDVKAADVLVLFADDYEGRPGCGKFIEFGLAYAMGKRIVVTSEAPSRSVFFNLPGVIYTADWRKALKEMS